MAAAVSIRSAPLKCPRKIAATRRLDGRTHNLTTAIAPGTVVSSAGTRGLAANLKKVGRFVVKCLADAAMDSTTIWF
jgi:hypothetical protein